MNVYDAWNKALKNTEIVRPRARALQAFEDTAVPYILLSESSFSANDTVVRKGEVVVQKPALVLPPSIPQFDGFEFDEQDHAQEDALVNFLLVRGVRMPSLKYNNRTSSFDMHEGKLSEAVRVYNDRLQRKENVHTGLIIGPGDCWQFSLLLYVCSQVARNADTDIKSLLKKHKESDE